MATSQIGIRNSNIIVPYTAATKRSKQVDITFTGSNLATILMAKAIFYADSAGAWRMRFNIAYTPTATAVSETITLTNISTAGLAASQVFSATNSTAAQSVLYSVVSAASPAVMSVAFSATTSSNREFSGDIALGAEPTAYTTAANMEGALPVDVYIPPASAGIAGLVNNVAGNTAGTPILGKTDGAAVAAGYVGEKITWVSAPATQVLTTSVADWTNAYITLPKGRWELVAGISAIYITGITSGSDGFAYACITDSSNNILNEMENIISAGYSSGTVSVFTRAVIPLSTIVDVALDNTVYKIRVKRSDNSGTGSGSVENASVVRSRFYAIRIA